MRYDSNVLSLVLHVESAVLPTPLYFFILIAHLSHFFSPERIAHGANNRMYLTRFDFEMWCKVLVINSIILYCIVLRSFFGTDRCIGENIRVRIFIYLFEFFFLLFWAFRILFDFIDCGWISIWPSFLLSLSSSINLFIILALCSAFLLHLQCFPFFFFLQVTLFFLLVIFLNFVLFINQIPILFQ